MIFLVEGNVLYFLSHLQWLELFLYVGSSQEMNLLELK